MKLSTLSISVVIVSVFILLSCKKDTNYETFYGSETLVGNGNARTFFTVSNSGVPQEIGVVFTEKALSGLPTANTTYILDLNQKAIEATPFKYVVVGLSATGHGLPPTGHITAHFDVRYFIMPNEERDAIPTPEAPLYPPPAGAGFDTHPPSGYLPDKYVMNYAVAKMGRHWASNDFVAGAHVEHTMIYGTYNGVLTFIAPIVTVAELATGHHHSIAYPQPQKFAKPGYYATKYNITKDDKGNHLVTLSDFVLR